jgi:hypothetical protein
MRKLFLGATGEAGEAEVVRVRTEEDADLAVLRAPRGLPVLPRHLDHIGAQIVRSLASSVATALHPLPL